MGFLLFLLWNGTTSLVFPPCYLEENDQDEKGLLVWKRHLVGSCSEEDREEFAIPASTILTVLQSGRGIDLEGVVVIGDLSLDQLAFETVILDRTPSILAKQAFLREKVEAIRVIHGPLKMRHTHVRGTLATNIMNSGYLLIKGAVDMTGTTFERAVDFSRSIFLHPVNFSEAVIMHEGFFIHALFDAEARFEKTAFGTHSRFHKSVFGHRVTFTGAGFNGLAEFLEVTFQRETGFSRTRFTQGTGFSGSHFQGILDFSEATFDREVFFRFAVFDKDAYFRRTRFRGEADFTEAQFQGRSDFTKVVFDVPPRITGIEIPYNSAPLGLQDPRVQAGILAFLAVFLALVLFLKKT